MSWREDLRADLARNCNQGTLTPLMLVVIRGCRSPRPLSWAFLVLDRLFLRLLSGVEIPASVQIGAGVGLPHAARGVVIHPDAKIGENCMLFHRVTLAATSAGAPVLADNVIVGVGACVLGPVHVGSYAKIGANAVVVKDVPAGSRVIAAATQI